MTRTRPPSSVPQRTGAPNRVSRPHDPAERQADDAANEVARGATITEWSFSSVPVGAESSAVHRQESGKPPADDDKKLKEAGAKVAEAALETPAGKKLQEKVKETPLVKKAGEFLDTTAGKVVAGGVVAGGVAGLAAAKQPLPIQPTIPLDTITPGLSAQVTVEGPLNAPTFAGLSLTYKEQGPKGRSGPSGKDTIAGDIARLRAQQEMFKPEAQKAQEKADDDAAIAHVIALQSKRFGSSTLLPLKPADKPKTVDAPQEQRQAEEKKGEETPVQREADSASAPADVLDTSRVTEALGHGGRALEPSLRRSMEARFGYDFAAVRVHDDARARAAARDVQANAFTVGEHVAFAAGRFDPTTPAGRRLLAHELAHVVQQSGGRSRLQRKAAAGALSISHPLDGAERQADEVADRVLAGAPAFAPGSGPTAPTGVARDALGGGDEPEGDVWPPLEDDPWPDSGEGPDEQSGGTIQASRDQGPSTTPPGFARALVATTGGAPLPAGPRATLERSFGRSFSDVRLHRSERADALTGSIGARAFAWGSDVFLARSTPPPSQPAGLRLLAHELAHVCQQASTPSTGRIHRSRALYFSTRGRPGYFRWAERFHRDRGFPVPVHVGSVEEMLEHLVTLSTPIESVRVVTHAVPAGIFLSLLRGGSTSLFQQDLQLRSQSGLENELATEHPTVGRANEVRTLEHHVVTSRWAADIYARLARDPSWAPFRAARNLPATVRSGGDLEALLWWTMDREVLTAQRPARAGRQRAAMRHVIPMSAPARAQAVASLERNVAYYRNLAVLHLASRSNPRSGTPEQRREEAARGVAELEHRVVQAAAAMIDDEAARGGLARISLAVPSGRYGSIQGALERGTYSNNLLTAKARFGHGMPFEIRGCRIGQNLAWLQAFRDFWGLGIGAPPGGRRPDVSAPDLRHIFGLRVTGRGRRATRVSAEWLQGPRGRAIYGGTPEFDEHIVHAR